MTELQEIQREVDEAYAYYTGGHIDARAIVQAACEIEYLRTGSESPFAATTMGVVLRAKGMRVKGHVDLRAVP